LNLRGKISIGLSVAGLIALTSIQYFPSSGDNLKNKDGDDDPVAGGAEGVLRLKPSESGLWGYIDATGRIMVAKRFNRAGPFSCGRAIVGPKTQYDGNHQQIIDKSGTVVHGKTFYYITEFREGLAGCSHLNYGANEDFGNVASHVNGLKLANTYTFVDTNGDLLPFELKAMPSSFSQGEALVAFSEKMSTLIHRDGSVIKSLENIYNCDGDWADNRLPVRLAPSLLNVKYGYIDRSGNLAIKPTFAKARTFHDGLAAVELISTTPREFHEVWGFIDTKGVFKFPTPAAAVNDFSEERLVFKADTGYGFLDNNGHIAIQPNYKYARSFHEGLASCLTKNNKSVYIDKMGRVLIEATYPYCGDFHEGLASIRTKEGFCGFINKQNKLVIQPEYTDTGFFSEGLAAVKFAKLK
jgi:hypothetical protein